MKSWRWRCRWAASRHGGSMHSSTCCIKWVGCSPACMHSWAMFALKGASNCGYHGVQPIVWITLLVKHLQAEEFAAARDQPQNEESSKAAIMGDINLNISKAKTVSIEVFYGLWCRGYSHLGTATTTLCCAGVPQCHLASASYAEASLAAASCRVQRSKVFA